MKWVDIGINLTNKRFDKDRADVIGRALQAGVNKMVITGTNIFESQTALTIATKYPDQLYSTAGCHPHDAKSLDDKGVNIIEELAQNRQVVAIGECGLDFNRDFSPRAQQIKAFKQQLELAVSIGKPVFLHERDAFDAQYQILKDYMPNLVGAVSHCFTGEKEHLEKYLQLGLHIGITGWICDERRGVDLFNMVELIPDDKLMIETDGPYLTPRNLPKKPKGGRNEPMYLPHIAETIAVARNQSLQHISNISYTNSCHFFNLSNA